MLPKVVLLDACIEPRVVGAVLVVFLQNLHNPPAHGKQGPIPKEIYQTWTKYMLTTLLSLRKLALTAKITLFVL